MDLFGADIDNGLKLADKINPKYQQIFQSLGPEQRAALAWYFLPHQSRKQVLGVTRPRILKWYCPFANQKDFPSGHRYCINVYTGCGHKCEYCYAAGYEPDQPNCKNTFENKLLRDLDDLVEPTARGDPTSWTDTICVTTNTPLSPSFHIGGTADQKSNYCCSTAVSGTSATTPSVAGKSSTTQNICSAEFAGLTGGNIFSFLAG